MEINPKIFKSYDIRGVYGTELNDEFIEYLAQAFYLVYQPDEVVVGYDARHGSKPLAEQFMQLVSTYGIRVTNIGMCSTPRLYYATKKYETPVGVMVTASHSPKDQSGFKFSLDNFPPLPHQVTALKETIFGLNDGSIQAPETVDSPAPITQHDVFKDYKTDINSLLPKTFKPLSVVVDTGNSVNGPIVRDFFEGRGLSDIVYLFDKIDPEFPNHGLNPKLFVNQEPLRAEILKQKADIGVLFDGDGDRAYFLDSNGEVISPHFVSAMIGSYIIKNNESKKMTIEVRTSRVVQDVVEDVGGTVEVIKAWAPEIKYAMIKDEEIIFGSETSGHYVYRDFFKIDDGLLTALMFLAAVSELDESLPEYLTKLKEHYFILEEINYSYPNDVDELLKKLHAMFDDADERNFLDGLTVTYDDWRFNLRASKTEPVIRLNLSANSTKLLEQKRDELTQIILDNGGSLAES